MALVLTVLTTAACGGDGGAPPAGEAVLEMSWSEVLAEARGQQVTFGMWTGDPMINAYIEEWVAPRLADRFGVQLEVVSAQGRDVLTMLMTELEANVNTSQLDLVWINGENFYQLRQIDALLGPFTGRLPAIANVDMDDPFIRYDFQQEIAGYEAPWGTVQLILIFDTERVASPPRTPDQLAEWVRANPGRFTFNTDFTGMTLLKSVLIHFAGGPGSLAGPFDEGRYERAAARLWSWLREIQPYLWKEGRTFPATVAQLHQLFAAGEIDFTMSNNDGEVDAKVLQRVFPETARGYVLDTGTIRNSHYLGVPKRSGQAAGALVTIDFLLSPQAQLAKLRPEVWGDGTVLDLDRLPPEWQQRFASVRDRRHTPPSDELSEHALMEPAPETMIRLFDGFRREILGE